MQAPLQARNDSDAAQTDAARTVAQKRVLADKRPEAVAQRKLAEMMNNSPRVLQQRALSDAIDNSPRKVAQRHKMNALIGGVVKPHEDGVMPAQASPAQREEKTNNTGLPNQLKSGIESLSGMSMDHVKVHYNSDKPAQLQAMVPKKMGPPKESGINHFPPIYYHHAEVMQLMPWYARMAVGAVPGAMLGGLGVLGVIPALALGVAGAGIGVHVGNDAAEEDQIPAHGSAEGRLARMRNRGIARRDRERISTGRYDTPTGPTTVSGMYNQRMTQSRKEDFGGETFGSLPAYDKIQPNLPDGALPLLSDRNANKPQMTDREKLATSLLHTLVHGSEEDRAPGTSSYFRAVNRDFIRTGGGGLHPLSTENFPARRTAQEQRDLMEGRTALSEQQRRALEYDSGASSDEDEGHYIDR